MFIGAQPRLPLASLPTPLQEARNLRAALGGRERCPRILIKRDDLTGLAFGGNKARKVEFLVADALEKGATVLVTVGWVQSNHARTTAAAARIAGLRAVLVLAAKGPQADVQGNLLLDRLLDAEVHFVLPESADERIAEIMAQLRDRGERPYLIPAGGSNAIGVLGYVAGTLEIVTQLFALGEAPSRLYCASGSRGTQAGLALGTRLYGAPYRLYGIAISSGDPEKSERAVQMANEAAAMLGVPTRLTTAELLTDQGYIGESYGIPTVACLEAILLLARNEGIFLDPVYSGKAMAGMIDHIRRGDISPGETVIFLHTGGSPALFAMVDQLGLGV